MLVHIVMFAFKDENKESNLAHVKSMLEALPNAIESLKSMEVGIDISKSERSFDLVLTSTFEDQVALRAYAEHQAHLEVVNVIKEVTTMAKVVDYLV